MATNEDMIAALAQQAAALMQASIRTQDAIAELVARVPVPTGPGAGPAADDCTSNRT